MIIYKATNEINGKVYIGQTTISLNERMGDHKRKSFIHKGKSHFYRAIRKYGFGNFTWNILHVNVCDIDTLNALEELEIIIYNSMKNGYNSTTGGGNAKHSKETIEKIRKANIGRKQSEEEINNRSKKLKGLKKPPGIMENLRLKNIGSKRTPEQKRKMSEMRKNKCIGSDNPKAVLNEKIVRLIKIKLKNGERICDISREYEINKSTIKNIKYNLTWEHVKI